MSFRQTLPLLSQKSTSSTQWISRQSRDPYVKKRVSDPAVYRSRSAFKLLEINENMGGFLDHDDVKAVVDLGAAPGGWSQVVAGKFGWGNTRTKQLPVHDSKTGTSEDGNACSLSGQDANDCALGVEVHSDSQFPFSEDKKAKKKKRRRKPIEDELEHYDPLNIENLDSVSMSAQPGRGTIVAVDLLPIVPIPGVKVIRGDFLLDSTTQLIKKSLATRDNPLCRADVILSDMAANVSGNTAHDIQSSLEICGAVFEYAKWNLRSADNIGRKKGGVLL